MNLLTKPEMAIDFPRQDLSESNAQLLSLMLANKAIVQQGHNTAEKISFVYRVGHAAIKVVAHDILSEPRFIRAFDHGVRTYETIAWLTSSAPERCDMFSINRQAHQLVSGLTPDELSAHIDAAYENLVADLPRTAAVITESAERFYPAIPHYAVYGASLARQFELDSVE